MNCQGVKAEGRQCPDVATGTMDFTTYENPKAKDRTPEHYCDYHLDQMYTAYMRQGIWTHTERHA